MNLFAMEEEQEEITKTAQPLNMVEKAQVAAASLGFVFFVIAHIKAYDHKLLLSTKKNLSLLDYPSIITGRPFKLIILKLVQLTQSNCKKLGIIFALLTALTSAASAADCALYVIKKLH